MTLFFISASLLVLLSVGWLLVGLFRSDSASTDQEAVNITLARERSATLEKALSEGAIDQSTYDYEREQLAYDLAADLTVENSTTTRKGGHIVAAVLVSAFIPIASGALYLHIGNPAAITQERTSPVVADNTQNQPPIAEMLPVMEERLKEQPDDIAGWRLLGRSYLSIGEFAGARRAFEAALALDEDDVPTITQLAESIAMTQQGDLSGEPLAYAIRANELDPDNEHALWLVSIAQQQAGDHDLAMQGFDRLVKMAAGNTEALATIDEMRARSVQAMGASETSTNVDSDTMASSEDKQPPAAGPAIEVSVSLSEQALEAADNDQIVFVYATATQGPPMPLAVSKLRVVDLPVTITLDNSMAMIPSMTLSTFPSVTIGARISKTGDAIAQTGDWFSEATNIDPGSIGEVELTIDQQKP